MKEAEKYGNKMVIDKAKTANTTLENEEVETYYPTEKEIFKWQKQQGQAEIFLKKKL
ncbi:hypothetical protein QFZ28_002212 [Neobacillus niacini]|uniref:hypothetical protein n=1 Tax=Neobacillus niacini TaxID=86668 RepID=UPI002786707C|nr:hypothetical protein [Neobacillus niacini]MDQ1001812.1 hypothetical protein [Neobacillus niacini]